MTGSSAVSGQSAKNRPDQSPWLYLDAANTLFHVAKRRAYLPPPSKSQKTAMQQANADAQAAADGSEDDLEALREVEMADVRASVVSSSRWPPGVEPVLEELPKWGLLAGVLEEIEEEIESLDRQGIEGASAESIKSRPSTWLTRRRTTHRRARNQHNPCHGVIGADVHAAARVSREPRPAALV